MLINLSNHPLSTWSEEQKNTGFYQFGTVIDFPFPPVDPNADYKSIISIAKDLVKILTKKYNNDETVFHVMGEMTLTYHLVNLLKQNGFTCVASTTERKVNYLEDGTKNVTFNFVRFREY
ncbi:MAG: CRISPR-associated protein [Paludibacteraceae bacterium]|nr:CRISPR-associated protein [Paludibacteraceae bacterium]